MLKYINAAYVGSLIRAAIISGSTTLVASGYGTGSDWEMVAGAAGFLVSLAWSWVTHVKSA